MKTSLKDQAKWRHLSDGKAEQKKARKGTGSKQTNKNKCLLVKIDNKFQSYKETSNTELNEDF